MDGMTVTQNPQLKRWTFKIKAVAKPRLVWSDRWRKRDTVERYHSYCDELRLIAASQKFTHYNSLKIIFYLSPPASKSLKKREEMINSPHTIRPDLDNLIKGFLDALYDEDSRVWHINAKKLWGDEDKIIIEEL